MAVAPSRWQTSRATSLVTGGFIICLRVALILLSETRWRKGDWRRATPRPWRSVSSNTGSPVEFTKPASITEADAVNSGLRSEKKKAADARTARTPKERNQL